MENKIKIIILIINELQDKETPGSNSTKSADMYNKKTQPMSHPNRNNSKSKKRKNRKMKKEIHKPEKLSIKSWPPEVNVENPSYVGAVIIIAVVFITGLIIWLQSL